MTQGGRRVRFAVAGVGMIGHRHIAMVMGHPEAELVAVCDVRSPGECAAPAGVAFYGDIDEMLSSAGAIDVVCICSPNGFHGEQAVKALRSGCHVVVEKPLALSTAEAELVREAAEASGRQVFCVFQNRYTPTSQWVKQVVDESRLGRLTQVVVNCLWNRDGRYYQAGHWHGTARYDGGGLFTQFSHYLDILLWLVGPIEIRSAEFADFAHRELTDFEDTGNFLFRTAGGALGSFNYSTAVPLCNMESSIVLVGTRGSIKIGGQYMNEVVHCVVEGYEMPVLAAPNPPNDYGAYKGSAANHSYVIDNVVQTLLHGGEPTAAWSDGMLVVRTIEEVYSLRKEDFSSSRKLTYDVWEGRE